MRFSFDCCHICSKSFSVSRSPSCSVSTFHGLGAPSTTTLCPLLPSLLLRSLVPSCTVICAAVWLLSSTPSSTGVNANVSSLRLLVAFGRRRPTTACLTWQARHTDGRRAAMLRSRELTLESTTDNSRRPDSKTGWRIMWRLQLPKRRDPPPRSAGRQNFVSESNFHM